MTGQKTKLGTQSNNNLVMDMWSTEATIARTQNMQIFHSLTNQYVDGRSILMPFYWNIWLYPLTIYVEKKFNYLKNQFIIWPGIIHNNPLIILEDAFNIHLDKFGKPFCCFSGHASLVYSWAHDTLSV